MGARAGSKNNGLAMSKSRLQAPVRVPTPGIPTKLATVCKCLGGGLMGMGIGIGITEAGNCNPSISKSDRASSNTKSTACRYFDKSHLEATHQALSPSSLGSRVRYLRRSAEVPW